MIGRFARLSAIVLLALLAVSGDRVTFPSASQNIALRPLALDPAHPGPRRIGDLVFLNAWELNSRNESFGGFSALAALPGGRFVGVSDAGTLIGFGLTDNDAIDRPFIAPLPDSQGPGVSYRDRDSEGIAFDADSGQFWVSYEAKHAIRRFTRSFARSNGIVRSPEMQDWPPNKGAEAVIRLADGRFIVIAESLEGDATHQGLLYSGDPVEPGTAASRFTYRPPAGFRVTDGVLLPDGRVLVLNRRIAFPTGFSVKLALVEPAAFQKGGVIQGRVIATIAAPLLVDNFEGVTFTQDRLGTNIWLISDNNFSIFQRTLLMKFRLSERTAIKKPEAVTPGFQSL